MIQLFQLWNKHYFVCKHHVGAGINTLISISDGLGPSIFCRLMERTGPMREAMDERFVYFPPESAFRLCCFNNVSTFPYLYLDLTCKQLRFPPRRRYKQEKWKYKKRGDIIILEYWWYYPVLWIPFVVLLETVKTSNWYSFSKKIIKY